MQYPVSRFVVSVSMHSDLSISNSSSRMSSRQEEIQLHSPNCVRLAQLPKSREMYNVSTGKSRISDQEKSREGCVVKRRGIKDMDMDYRQSTMNANIRTSK